MKDTLIQLSRRADLSIIVKIVVDAVEGKIKVTKPCFKMTTVIIIGNRLIYIGMKNEIDLDYDKRSFERKYIRNR